MKRILITVLLLIGLSINIFAGPFGIDMGMSLEEVTKISKIEPVSIGDDAYLITPPNTNNLFEMYMVKIHHLHGVYLIKAIGVDISVTGYGDELKLEFNKLVQNLEKNYGKYKKIDYLKRGSIWKDADDFMMGLLKGDRSLIVSFDKESKATLPSDLKEILVGVSAKNQNTGYILLEYYSTKYDIITKEIEEKQNNVF